MRGGRRAAALIEDSADIVLDGVTLFGAQMALRTARVNGLRITDSALRGHAAPWHSRAHHKYRAQAGYLVIADGDNFEFENCELTDNHDFLLLFGVENIRIHGCLVDNFNDDGFEPGPKRAHGKILIFQNLITRCLSPFTAHGKKPVPVDSEPGSGVYVFRNIADLRRGIYKFPPEKPDPSGAFLDEPVEILAHDHGSPLHPNYYVYQNTFLMRRGGASDSYAFTWGAHTHGTARRVFNNLFVQAEGTPRNVFTALSAEDDFQSDANLFWSLKGEEPQSLEIFAKFRQSPLFAASRRQYAPGWGNSDILADPQFVSPDKVGARPCDLRLRESSPAARAGIALPADWPDPLRPAGEARPDIGALPIGADAPRFGIHGRIAVDGTESKP